MKKKVFTIFVLLIFASQILPVKQFGKLLLGNQITEEVIQDTDDLAQKGFKSDVKSEFIEPSLVGVMPCYIQRLFMLKELSVVLPHNHSNEVYSPPPNCQIL